MLGYEQYMKRIVDSLLGDVSENLRVWLRSILLLKTIPFGMIQMTYESVIEAGYQVSGQI